MGTEFDPAEESKFISYLDTNNLYGWVMSKQLPTSGFEWMTDDELDDWKQSINHVNHVELLWRHMWQSHS